MRAPSLQLDTADALLVRWLEAESFRTDDWSDETTRVAWGFRAQMRGVWIEVASLPEQPFVLLRARISLATEHQRVYDALSPDERSAFHRGVHALVAHAATLCELDAEPADDSALRIALTRHLYAEELGRQRFMDEVRALRNLAGAVIRVAQGHLHEEHGVTA